MGCNNSRFPNIVQQSRAKQLNSGAQVLLPIAQIATQTKNYHMRKYP
jgi:hypothetical protein